MDPHNFVFVLVLIVLLVLVLLVLLFLLVLVILVILVILVLIVNRFKPFPVISNDSNWIRSPKNVFTLKCLGCSTSGN